MTDVQYQVRIAASAGEVWETLADFGNIYRFNPNVHSSHSTSDAPTGLDATRHCDLTVAGASIEERIIGWVEGASYTVEIYEGRRTPPLKTMTATLRVEPAGAAGSTATMAIAYELKGGRLGRLMDGMIVRSQYEKAASLLLAGLKHHVETGEDVDAGTRLNRSVAVSA